MCDGETASSWETGNDRIELISKNLTLASVRKMLTEEQNRIQETG